MNVPTHFSAVLRPRRARYQELVYLLAFTTMLFVVFALWPKLDLVVSAWFYAGEGQFPARQWAWVRVIYDHPKAAQWVVIAALLVFTLGRFLPGRLYVARPWRRRCFTLLLAAALGVGWLVHDVVKEVFNRPRPQQVTELGGSYAFVPAFRAGEQCRDCVSFVSGHAAGGYVYMAWGLLGTPAVRRRWFRIGLAAGSLLGAVRILQGGHFLSDVLFAAALMWLCCWLLRETLLRVACWVQQRKAKTKARVAVVSTA